MLEAMQEKYFLGIDAGGTKTHALIIDQLGQTLGEWKTGPGNYTVTGLQQTKQNILDAIIIAKLKAQKKRQLQDISISSACFALASLDTKKDHELLLPIMAEIFQQSTIQEFKLVNDTRAALRSGTDNPNAIVLICGTGSNCYGRNKQNKESTCGGLDYILSDTASGYSMGYKALRYAVQSMDQMIRETILEKYITKELNIKTMREAKQIVYATTFTKKEIAALSTLVFQGVKKGDWAAELILAETIDEAVQMISTVAHTLQFKETWDLVLAGGLWENTPFKDKVVEKIKDLEPKPNIKDKNKSAAWGAAQLAIETVSS